MDFMRTLWPPLFEIFTVIFGALLLDFFQKRILKKIHAKLSKKGSTNQALVAALKTPLTLIIWVVAITFAGEILEQNTNATLLQAFKPIRTIGIVLAITWFAIRLVKEIQAFVTPKTKEIDPATVEAISKVTCTSIVITASLMTMQSLGFSISGLLAFGGMGSLVIGFASKDLLSNVFGGFLLHWDRPFSVGDWIRSADREIEGVVEHIGLRLTRIRTFDKRPLYVPNSIFHTITLENPSRMTNRRIYETIGVRYQDAKRIEEVLGAVRTLLHEHPEIDQKEMLMVHLNAFGESSLELFVYTFTKTTDWAHFHVVKEDVLLKIYEVIRSHDAEIAYPTTTMQLEQGALLDEALLKPTFSMQKKVTP